MTLLNGCVRKRIWPVKKPVPLMPTGSVLLSVLCQVTVLQVNVSFCMALMQEAQVTLECTVPRKYHGNIMGPKGHRIQEISKSHNVTIKIPDRNTEGTAVTESIE